MHTPVATVDFETRSACKLRNTGTWRYSLDPITEVLCLAFRLPYWDAGRVALWHPAFPAQGVTECFPWSDLKELNDWINLGEPVEAHNAWFERGIWQHILAPKFGFPSIAGSQWRCSAAKAAAHALPRALDAAAVVLGLNEQKDMFGHKLMTKLSKPRKARKAEREEAEESGRPLDLLYFESPAMFDRLCAYCCQDVLTEAALSESLPDLNETELQVYLLDQMMNERGFGLDRAGVDAALGIIGQEVSELNAQLTKVTRGYVTAATKRADLLTWLEIDQKFPLPDTTKDTVNGILTSTRVIPAPARAALEILSAVGKSSTAKYTAMKNWICPDDRVHGGLLYHGASTGRWSGAGVQPQNFPKGKIKDQVGLWKLIQSGDRTTLRAWAVENKLSPNIMELLAGALRGAIVPTAGKQLYVADYASIEARVLLWLADDEDGMDLFRNGADLYLDMADSIYGYTCTKDDNPTERAVGKVAILGLGYQMGWAKFQTTCEIMARVAIDAELAQRTVNAYREKYWRVKQMWAEYERAAIAAVENPGETYVSGKVEWAMSDPGGYPFLYCTLPSGRRLAYPDPEVRPKKMSWGEERDALSYMGINSYTRQWQRQDSYGGLLVENVDQAISRDLMAAALLRCEAHPVYTPILSVHDELLAEAALGAGSVKEFEALMAECPDWATGCPVAAEGWSGVRYRK